MQPESEHRRLIRASTAHAEFTSINGHHADMALLMRWRGLQADALVTVAPRLAVAARDTVPATTRPGGSAQADG